MEAQVNNTLKKALLILNCFILAIGNCGGPLILRLYFVRGGKRLWLSSWLETAAWPIIFIRLTISYFHRRKTEGPNTKLILMKYPIFISTAFLGLLTGLDNYFYAYGLPASLSPPRRLSAQRSLLSLLSLLSFLLNKSLLHIRVCDDGCCGALYGLVLPMVELMYMKAKQAITYTLVLEIQLVLCFSATLFCTVGMLVNKDFQGMPKEARAYELGEAKYYVVITWGAIIWQFFFLGAIGVIFCASSLLCGIVIALLLPVTQILAVIFFHEKFQAEKGVALVLSLWGFVSHFYGEIKNNKPKEDVKDQNSHSQTTEMTPLAAP
ncbi:hypothetical protein ACH5RR_026953 [Cinchona calisaya]|uniref:Probable purine permease n=1 Tax=Cinchona calisaya TaxID=153742 RepID=A0ABD2Z432_9GENT